MRRTKALLAALLALAGCDHDSTSGLLAPEAVAPEVRAGSPALGVMTYNVYVGAPIDRVALVEDPTQVPLAVAEVFAAVQATDFAERSEAIADQIAARGAHVVGLQEVSLFRSQSPGDFLAGNPQPATTVVLDYLNLLLDALRARGLEYDVAASSRNFDIELPALNFSTGGLDDLRLTDFDVILVRSDVAWANPQAATFAAALPITVGGFQIALSRGWASVDLVFKGLPYRFVNTHLEPADIAPGVVVPELAALQAAQAAELLAIVDGAEMPVIMVGDFNSAADGSTTATYRTVIEAGFVDAWTVGRPRGDGFTSNQDADLLNPVSRLFHRIDFVFYRDDFTRSGGGFRGAVEADLAGEEPGDRTPSGLWPSDHAGVGAELRIAPGVGLRP